MCLLKYHLLMVHDGCFIYLFQFMSSYLYVLFDLILVQFSLVQFFFCLYINVDDTLLFLKKMCIFVCIRQNIINLYSLLESIHFNIVITHGNSIGAQKCLQIDGYELCCKNCCKTKNIYNTDTDVVKLFVVSSFFGFYHQNTRICNGQR